jgi:Uma2 family endonuclease
MTLEAFIEADFQEGWLYELARGVVEVTGVPDPWHGAIVDRIAEMFILYRREYPGWIKYRAGAAECRMTLPGMVSDRRPDQAVYLDPEPPGPKVWTRWIPHIVVEVVSPRGRKRDFIAKREEYLRMGVSEYWVLDPRERRMHAFVRRGDTRAETVVSARGLYRTIFLPGLEVRPGKLLGPADE